MVSIDSRQGRSFFGTLPRAVRSGRLRVAFRGRGAGMEEDGVRRRPVDLDVRALGDEDGQALREGGAGQGGGAGRPGCGADLFGQGLERHCKAAAKWSSSVASGYLIARFGERRIRPARGQGGPVSHYRVGSQ